MPRKIVRIDKSRAKTSVGRLNRPYMLPVALNVCSLPTSS